MSTRMSPKLYERRVECLRYYSKGMKPSEFTEDLSKKYGVSAQTIWRDFNNREQWLPVIVHMRNPEMVMAECLAELEEVKKAAWLLNLKADNDNARVAALKVILDAISRKMELNQPELGTPTRPFVIKKYSGVDASTQDTR